MPFGKVTLNKYYFRYAFIFISLFVFSSGCEKEKEVQNPPAIEFVADTSSVFRDTTLEMGSNMKFLIKIVSEHSPVTNLVVYCGEDVFLDSGLYSNNINFELNVTKGSMTSEKWTFTAMNKSRLTSSINATIFLSDSSDFNPVTSYPNIQIGAQNNSQLGSFWASATNTVHFLQQACAIQSEIDIIYYFDIYECTLSSPNESDAPPIFPVTCGLGEWTVKNETRYLLTGITEQEFDQISNDSLLIALYHPIDAKRKGKNAAPGQVWSFRLQNGKLGLICINETTHGTDGSVLISIKLQQ